MRIAALVWATATARSRCAIESARMATKQVSFLREGCVWFPHCTRRCGELDARRPVRLLAAGSSGGGRRASPRIADFWSGSTRPRSRSAKLVAAEATKEKRPPPWLYFEPSARSSPWIAGRWLPATTPAAFRRVPTRRRKGHSIERDEDSCVIALALVNLKSLTEREGELRITRPHGHVSQDDGSAILAPAASPLGSRSMTRVVRRR